MQNFSRCMLFVLAATVWMLSACASSSKSLKENAVVYYSNSKSGELISPEFFENSLEENQQMQGHYGEKKITGMSWMQLNDSLIHLMIFSSMGNEIANLVYTKDSLIFTSKWMDAKKVKPEYIIADIQFVYYPKNVLEKHFKKVGLEFKELKNEDVFVRTLSENDTLLMKMEKSKNQIRFENLIRKYEYQIERGKE